MAKVAKAFQFLGKTVEDVAKKLVSLGYPESTAKKIADGSLPMDEASRMARAVAQGFDIDNIMYHGTNPTAIQKIAKNGFKSSKGMPNEPRFGDVYFTPSKRYAQDYSYTGGRGFSGYEYPVDWELPTEKPLIGIEVGSKKNTMIPAFLRNAKKETLAKEFSANINDIRSLDAAFDPDYTGPNILGSRITPTSLAGLLSAAALAPEEAEAGKARAAKEGAQSLLDLWWHGSDEAFRTFDPEKLGTGEGGRDSAYGFYFGKKPATAESYLYNDQMINPKTFEEVYGMSMQDAQAKADTLLKGYAEKMGITTKEALDWNNPKSIRSVKAKMMHPEAKQHASIESALFPSTYEFGARGKGSRDWLADQRTGYLMGAELPSGEAMKYVDMSGEAWDEGKQALIARMARDEGYSGVVFQNMVDDAFSGSGADDIALVFDPRDINTRQVRPINAPDVNFDDLKSAALPTAVSLLNALDLNQQVAIDSGMAQLGYDKNRPEAAMYNYSGLLPIKRHKDTGEYSLAMTGILEEIARGLIDVGESRKTGRIQNPVSLLDILL